MEEKYEILVEDYQGGFVKNFQTDNLQEAEIEYEKAGLLFPNHIITFSKILAIKTKRSEIKYNL